MSFFYPFNFAALGIGVAKCSFQSVIVLQLHSTSFAGENFRGTKPVPSRDGSKHHPHFTQEE